MSQSSLKKFSTSKLEQEINKRRISELQTQKTMIEAKIKTLSTSTSNNKVEKLGKPVKKSSKLKKVMHKSRVAGSISLKDRLIAIGSDETVRTATEFLTILENDGWKSTSAKPYYVVSAGLASLAEKNVFRRVSKGSYQLVKNEPVVVVAQ
jgi:hypothetical protein